MTISICQVRRAADQAPIVQAHHCDRHQHGAHAHAARELSMHGCLSRPDRMRVAIAEGPPAARTAAGERLAQSLKIMPQALASARLVPGVPAVQSVMRAAGGVSQRGPCDSGLNDTVTRRMDCNLSRV